MATKTILSLFDYSGNWPLYYKLNGYDVISIDIKHGINVLDLSPEDFKGFNIVGILAAPPCTDFSVSGAQYWKAKDLDGRTQNSLSLVYKTLELVEYLNPSFYAIENPVGRLSTLVPELGKPWYFNPHEFAGYCDTLEEQEKERYTKKTGIWGKFNIPIKKDLGNNPNNNWIMKLGGKSEKTKELRSTTPKGFSKAFFLANSI